MKYLPFRKTVIFNDSSMTVYSIGWLALLTRRHPGTMRRWEASGLLPKPIFGTEIDPVYRYYSPGELMGYARIINSQPRINGKGYADTLKIELHGFRSLLKRQMQKDPAHLLLSLPNEIQIESALQNNSDARQRKVASALLRVKGGHAEDTADS